MKWIKDHALLITAIVLVIFSFSLFTWAEYQYFVDQALTHGEKHPDFWSAAHLHDWAYNAASNWQSEILMGVLVVMVALKIEGRNGADKGDT